MNSLITLCCLFWCVTPAAVMNIIAYPISLRWSRCISQYIAKVVAYRLFSILNCYRHFHFFNYRRSKKGLPPQFIVISNHQSLFDIPAYMRFFHDLDVRFVAKDTLARHIPLVSEMLRAHEHCMVPRSGSPMKSMKILEAFGRRILARNQIPILFPEGTRTHTGNVGKFYSAGFRKLNEVTHLPIAVCALDGGWQIRDVPHVISNLKNGCYRVKVLKVYPAPKSKTEEEAILTEARTMIQAQLDEWRQKSTDCA